MVTSRGCVWQFIACVLFIYAQNMIVVLCFLDEPELVNGIYALKIIFLRTLMHTLPSESHDTFP